jgi:hypothetical protein
MNSIDLADVAPVGHVLTLPASAEPISDHVPISFTFRRLRQCR